MAIERSYKLEVVAKWEGTHGFGQIMLRFPSVNHSEWVPNRPWWIDKTTTGSPITLDVTPEEMLEVKVGDLFETTVRLINDKR